MPDSNPLAEPTFFTARWRTMLIGLLVLALLYLLTSRETQQVINAPLSSSDSQAAAMATLKPSSTASNVSWRVFSPAGSLEYEVKASALQQFQTHQLMRVEEPEIRMALERKKPWLMQAERGEISRQPSDTARGDHADRLILLGNVEVTQFDEDPRRTLRLSTPRLDIFPAERRALTKASVEVRHARFTTIGKGLDLNLQTGTLRFGTGDNSRVISKLFLNDSSRG